MEVVELKEAIDGLGRAWEAHKQAMADRESEIKKIGSETAETKQRIERIAADLDKFDDLRSRLDKFETRINRPNAGGKTEEEAKAEAKQIEHKQAIEAYLRKYDTSKMETKSLVVEREQDGGYTVHSDMSGRTVRKIFETSAVRQVAAVQSISTDALEGMYDLSEAGAEWVNETETPDESDTPEIGKWRIPVHEIAARLHVSNKLLEDSEVNIEQWLINHAGRKFARTEETAFVNGNGSNKPRGYLTYAAGTNHGQIEQINSGAAGDITDADRLLNLVYSLKADYRANAKWALSREGIRQVRKIKQDNKWIWQPGLQVGQPSTLLDHAISEHNDLPAFANNSLSIVFADWQQFYQIVDRTGMSVLRDPYTTKPFIELYMRRRVGGAVVNFEAGKIMKLAA